MKAIIAAPRTRKLQPDMKYRMQRAARSSTLGRSVLAYSGFTPSPAGSAAAWGGSPGCPACPGWPVRTGSLDCLVHVVRSVPGTLRRRRPTFVAPGARPASFARSCMRLSNGDQASHGGCRFVLCRIGRKFHTEPRTRHKRHARHLRPFSHARSVPEIYTPVEKLPRRVAVCQRATSAVSALVRCRAMRGGLTIARSASHGDFRETIDFASDRGWRRADWHCAGPPGMSFDGHQAR